MRHTTRLATALLLLGLTACGKSAAEMQADCKAALTESSTKTDRPAACDDLSQEDYDALLMAYALNNALKDMPKKDRDLLDYHDDGSINGSITGD